MENPTIKQENPYRTMEFEAFLEHIGNENIANWTILAKALKVNRSTITRWKHHPRAREAINKAINESVKGMTNSGADDWRMWREKMKMLGVDDEQTIKHGVTEDAEEAIKEIAQKTDYDIFKSIGQQVVETVQPVQDKNQTGGVGDVQTQHNAAETPAGEGQPQKESNT